MVKKILDLAFWLSLAGFMLLGSFVVLGQIAGALVNQPEWVAALDGWPSSAAFLVSTICALVCFALQYLRPDEGADGR